MDQLRELSLFTGAGGGLLAGALLGWRAVCCVERDPYCQRVLVQRMRDGLLCDAPIWDDVQTFDGHPWRGRVDVISGGFPCQDISVAGKGAGLDGAKSGMWHHMARIIGEVGPQYVFVENSPALVTRGLERVLSDLAALGYDARWGVLGAADVGAPHRRERIWIRAELADADGVRQPQPQGREREQWGWPLDGGEGCEPGGWWPTEPAVGRLAHGVAHRVDQLRALGNGQVPLVAATAWRLLGGPVW